jgi:chemotaxis signal transduction protein
MTKIQNNSLISGKLNKSKTKISRFSVFVISEKLLGIELSNVNEVITLPKISKIPSAPKQILGVFSLRGKILTLLEISEALGIRSQEQNEENMVLIVDYLNQKVGILVEKVLDVIDIDESEIQMPTRDMSHKMAKNIIGYYENEGMGTINLLNLNELLALHNIS